MSFFRRLREIFGTADSAQDKKEVADECEVDENGYVIMKSSKEAQERLWAYVRDVEARKSARTH